MNRAKGPSYYADAELRGQSKVVAHDTAPVHAWLKSVLDGSLAARHAMPKKGARIVFGPKDLDEFAA